MRQLPKSDYLRIKARFRRLVLMCGGVVNAATITRVEKTALSDYGNPSKMECFPPSDVIADLEAEAGVSLVSREITRLVEDSNVRPTLIAEHEIIAEGAKVTVVNGEFQAAAIAALEDNEVDDQEWRGLIKLAGQNVLQAIELEDKLRLKFRHKEQSRRSCVTLDAARREREGAA